MIRGTSYVYVDSPYWNKEKKQNRHRREYIGKLGEDGGFVPNKKYVAHQGNAAAERDAVPTITPARRAYYGATYLLDGISNHIGIEEDLRICFPDNYKMLMSLAYYLVLESDSPLYRFPRWAHDHPHPWGEAIPSQRISEALRNISEAAKLEFFKKQSRRRLEKEYLAYDTTSISSYSEHVKAVRYGKNKDHDNLPQVNMALVFGEESCLPVYYRVLPGNIADVSTIRKLVKDVSFLEINKLKLVMDRGFYSAANMNALYKEHHKFLIAVKSNNAFVSKLVEKAQDDIHNFSNYDTKHEVYHCGSTEEWPYIQTDRHGNISLEEKRRIYVHIYYNGQRGEEDKTQFNKSLSMAEAAIREGSELTQAQVSLRERYFRIKETPKRGVQIQYLEDAIQKRMDRFGYFVLLSNDIKDSAMALEVYRRKDMIEKAFDNLKERLEMRRTAVHSDQALAGKLFIQFLALIYVSYIHKHMRDNNLYQNYTMQSLLDSLDVIERYVYDEQRHHYSEITKKQRELFSAFQIPPPTTL